MLLVIFSLHQGTFTRKVKLLRKIGALNLYSCALATGGGGGGKEGVRRKERERDPFNL